MKRHGTSEDDSRTPTGPGASSGGPGNGSSDSTSAVIPVVATTGVCTYAAMTALFPAAMAPEVAAGLGVTSGFVALQISVVYAGAMLTSLLGGTLIQRIGACRASQVALILIGAGAGTATAGAIATFAIGSFLIGLGYGLTNPAASHLLMRFAPAHRRRIIFSVKQTGVPLGGVLAGAIAPGFALALGWQGALGAVAALAALLVLLLQPARPRWDEDRDPTARLVRSPFADIRLVWSVRSLRLLSLAGPCFASIQLSLSAFTVTLLVDDMGIGIVKAGLIMSAVQIAGVAGRVAWGWVGDAVRSGAVAICLVTVVTIAGAAAVSLMTPAWPQPLVVLVLCTLGFSALGWNGVYLAEVARLAPGGVVARASGGALFFTFSGVLVGPPAFSTLAGIFGSYARSFSVLAAVAALGLGLVLAGSAGGGRTRE